MTKPAYPVAHPNVRQTRIILPEEYRVRGLADADFECWVDTAIADGVVRVIAAGWLPISSCSGLAVDHPGRMAKGISPMLVLYLRDLRQHQYLNPANPHMSPFRAVIADGVYIFAFKYRNDLQASNLWDRLFRALTAYPKDS